MLFLLNFCFLLLTEFLSLRSCSPITVRPPSDSSFLWKTILRLRPALYPGVAGALVQWLVLPVLPLHDGPLVLQLLLQLGHPLLHPCTGERSGQVRSQVLTTFQLQCGRVLLLLRPVEAVHQPVDDVHHAGLGGVVHPGGLQHGGHGHHELWQLGSVPGHLVGRVIRFLVGISQQILV